MKEIQLTQSKVTLVDDEDYEELLKYEWTYTKPKYSCGNEYVRTWIYVNKKRICILMHRLLMGVEKGQYVDHKDRNGLNNQKDNLRICTKAENCWNKKVQVNSKYKGVRKRHLTVKYKNKKGEDKICYRKPSFTAFLICNKKRIYLGQYKTEIEAAKAYNEGALKYYGEFSCLNII